MTSRPRSAVTFVEMIIATVVVSFILMGGYSFLSTATRGSQQGQEVTSHIRATALLFRSLQFDVQGLLPWVVKTTKGIAGMSINGSPTPDKATEILFCTLREGKFTRVRYRFDKVRHEVVRTQEDTAGKILNAQSYGTGFIEDFLVSYDLPNVDLMNVRIVLGIPDNDGRKIRESRFSWFLSRGVPNASEAVNWIFRFEP